MIPPFARDMGTRLSGIRRRLIETASRSLARPRVKVILFVLAFLIAWLWDMPTAHAA